MKKTVLLIALCLAMTSALAMSLFDKSNPIERSFKPSNGATVIFSEDKMTIHIPAGKSWPLATARFKPALDCSKFSNLKFYVEGIPNDNKGGWGVSALFGTLKTGGYFHTLPANREGAFEINLDSIPPAERKLEQIIVFFKNPEKELDVDFKGFELSASDTEPVLVNFAHGRPAVFEPLPNYKLTGSESDKFDLTDGHVLLQDGIKMWSSPKSVGWGNVNYGGITFDLGKIKSVSKVRYHCGAGLAGVYWPDKLYLLVSDDNIKYYLVDELMNTNRHSIPSYGNLKNLWLESQNLNFKAKYIRIVFKTDRYNFVDEIEVYEGNGANCISLNQYPEVSASINDFITGVKSTIRKETDIALIKKNAAVRNVNIDAQLAKLEKELKNNPQWLKLDQSLVPVNKAQEYLLGVNQEILELCGFKGVVKWDCHRWKPINIFSYPENSCRELNLFMMNGERRSRVINLTNSEKAPRILTFKIESTIKIKPYLAVCTDTKDLYMVTTMIKDIKPDRTGRYQIMIEPGATRQLWLEFLPNSLNGGKYQGKIEFNDGSDVSYTVNVNQMLFPEKFSTILGMFDYIHTIPSKYKGINTDNINSLREILKKHRYTDYWCSFPVIPNVDAGYFDQADRLVKELDFSAFDRWIKFFPDARIRFMFFELANKGAFAGIDMDKNPDKYSRRISAYFNELEEHVCALGLSPADFIVLCVDEAYTMEQLKIISVIALAIKNSGVKPFKVFSDPRINLIKTSGKMFNSSVDYLSPEFPMPKDKEDMDFYIKESANRSVDKYWGFYRCADGIRQLDPCYYYLLPFWAGMLCRNFTCMNFWSLEGAPEGYNDYTYQTLLVSPLFFNKSEIFSSKHMEAMYEGREDYEYFLTLQNLIVKLNDISSETATKYRKYLEKILKEFKLEYDQQQSDALAWNSANAKDYGLFDRLRERMWAAINEICLAHPELMKH